MTKKKSLTGKSISDLDELIENIIVDAYNTDEQLWAFSQVIEDEIELPADAFVIGEPVAVIDVDYDGNKQRGLTATCRCEDGSEHVVALFDVVFPQTFEGIRTMAAYRRWLNLEPWPDEGRNAKSKRKHKAKDEDIDLGRPADLAVLSLKEGTARCRLTEGQRELTLRSGELWDVVPGMVLTVSPKKHWRFNGHPYLSGEVQSARIDAEALNLIPLGLADRGTWNPNEAWRGDEDEPIDEWVLPIVTHGPRPMFEMEQILPDQDPSDSFNDPITKVIDLNSTGERAEAMMMLMDLCRKDMRCLDAHAHLGNLSFDHRPQEAIRHYEVGLRIGELSLGDGFTGVLPWGFIDNRPFLRCMHGYGLCLWRLNRFDEAEDIFHRILWLNPQDNQGVRFLCDEVKNKTAWENWKLE